MATTANKTVRFARVVARSGRPHVHTQWLALGKDAELKRALDAHRVMAIDSARGKTDIGHVATGSLPKGGGRYLVFPKSLKSFERARVVGIKFDLVEQDELVPARTTAHAPRKKKTVGSAKPWGATTAEEKRKEAGRKAKERFAKEKPFANAPPGRMSAEDKPPTVAPSAVRRAAAKPPTPRHRRPADHVAERKRTAGVKSPSDGLLRREVRAALRLLKAGKTVAAYQRLDQALAGE